MTTPMNDGGATRGREYTDRLVARSDSGWRRWLDVQRPYRWNLRRQDPGRCLDIGTGVGRHLTHLPAGSVGIDHNPTSVDACRDRGLEAYTPDEFAALPDVGTFDSLLLAHVLEHVDQATAVELLTTYGRYLRDGGRAIVITPQERGFASDPTHIRWSGFEEVERDLDESGFDVVARSSFPFPRLVGRVFYANEFVVVGLHRRSDESVGGA